MQNNLNMLNEAYVGKTDHLIEIEYLVKKLRKKYNDKLYPYYKLAMHIDKIVKSIPSDPDFIRIGTLLEKEFGLNVIFDLDISVAPTQLNALSYPISMITNTTDYSSLLMKKGSRIMFRPEANMVTYISISPPLFFDEDITPEEVVGVLIHEVGHNFDIAMTPELVPIMFIRRLVAIYRAIQNEEFNVVTKILGALGILFGQSILRYFYTNTDKKDMGNPIMEWAMAIINLKKRLTILKNQYLLPMLIVKKIKKIIDNGDTIANISTLPLQIATTFIFTYTSEKTSDSFAALYGYGPALSTGLKKIHDINAKDSPTTELITKIPIIGHSIGLWAFLNDHYNSLLEGHPALDTRMKTVAALLREDIKQTKLNPKVKLQVQKDLDKIDDIIAKWQELDSKQHQSPDGKFTNYADQTFALLQSIPARLGLTGMEIRSLIMEKFYGGSSTIVKNINKLK